MGAAISRLTHAASVIAAPPWPALSFFFSTKIYVINLSASVY